MDYDFITTCNWTQTGTFTLRAYRGADINVVSSYTLYYRKKGSPTWSSTSNGQINITSTGEWEVGNNWQRGTGIDDLTHSYYGITAIDRCTNVYFNTAGLGAKVGGWFLNRCWYNCSSLTSMPDDFNIPSGITTVGYSFLGRCWAGCSSLTHMPEGFNIPQGIVGNVYNGFLLYCWTDCSSLTHMPEGFNIPNGITTVGNYFFQSCWSGCTNLTSIPEGFNLPSGITTVGSQFLHSCWRNCTNLKQNGNTEDLVFEFDASQVFGGTCPVRPQSVSGASKVSPVYVAVNRSAPLSPEVTTTTTTRLTDTMAIVGGDVTDSGSTTVIERGIYYGENEFSQPTKVSSGTGAGVFAVAIVGLDPNTVYYFKSFATNSVGTSYGDVLSFKTGKNTPTEGIKYPLPPFGV